MIKVHVIGTVPKTRLMPVANLNDTDVIVVGGNKENLFTLCDQIPQVDKPVVFVSDFSQDEVAKLETLGITALTPDMYIEFFSQEMSANTKLPPKEPVITPAKGNCAGKIIAIGSNKGGVGKTFISTNLAVYIALAQPDKKVVAIEFDGEKEDFIMAAYLSEPPQLTVMNYLTIPGENIEAAHQPTIPNLYIIPYGNQDVTGLMGRMSEDRGSNILKKLRQSFDYVVVDMGIFADLWCIGSVLGIADKLVLVADEGRECVSRLASFLFMKKITAPKYLVVNRITGQGYYSPGDVARALGFDNFYSVPEDFSVNKAMKKRKFPVQGTKTAAGKSLNKAFEQMLELKINRPGFWSKIIRKGNV